MTFVGFMLEIMHKKSSKNSMKGRENATMLGFGADIKVV